MSTATATAAPRPLTLPSDQDASGRTLGDEEIAMLTEAIRSGTLTSTKGEFTKRFETAFAELHGAAHGHACSSGTAALHCAVAAVDPEPGEEIITTAITDMGGITPILYQGAVPVFADVCPRTYNVTAETIEARLSDRTRAIMVTHLFGNPCDMDPIMELAKARGIPVIEDCAQAFLATYKGRKAGTLGDIGCFSLQQGKHITTGEGGVVITDDEALARRVFLFINKAWGYGDQNPDHYFAALNYRMNELTGAVALAQLAKLEGVVARRRDRADALTGSLGGLAGISAPQVTGGAEHSWWKYCLHSETPEGSPKLGAFLRERGIACAPRYIQKPAFRCQVLDEQRTFGASRWPLHLARPEAVDYSEANFPGTFEALERVLVLPWNEAYTDEHVEHIAAAVREGAATL